MTARPRKPRRLTKAERDTLAMRSPTMADVAASDAAAAELLDVERVRFIRETAQLLFIRSRDGVRKTDDLDLTLSARVAWQLARELWDGKPEEC